MYAFLAILVLVVIIFGISSTTQSYASAQQAKAQIETAQVAQINAWGNLVTILTVSLLIVVVVALLAAALWLVYRRSAIRGQRSAHSERPQVESRAQPQISVSDLIQLEALRMIKEMRGSSAPALPDKSADDDVPLWLQ